MPRRKAKDKEEVRRARPPRLAPRACPFDKGSEPSYKNYAELARFVSDRGKIMEREHTGVCAKHQRKLTREIKRARHLALLPFVIRPA